MCFRLLIIEPSVLPIKFPASFHQISPIVYEASSLLICMFLSCDRLTLLSSCYTSAIGSFFLSWFVSFNLSIKCLNHQPASLHYWLVHPYKYFPSSFVWITFLSISSRLSPTWLIQLSVYASFLSIKWISFLLNGLLFNW